MPEDKDYHVVDKADWFKIHHTGWLEGSLRYSKEYDGDKLAAFRGVMTDICALISRSRFRDGSLRYAVGKPMPVQQIARILNISEKLLSEFIDFSLKDVNNDNDKTRIEIWEDGTINVVNWRKYQAVNPKNKHKSKEPTTPLTIDERKQKQEIQATELAYKFPDRAKKGIERRDFDNAIKPKTANDL